MGYEKENGIGWGVDMKYTTEQSSSVSVACSAIASSLLTYDRRMPDKWEAAL